VVYILVSPNAVLRASHFLPTKVPKHLFMKITALDPTSKDAQELLGLSNAYLKNLYPSESNHLASISELSDQSTVFLGIYDGETILGCGAVKVMEDDGQYGELKRVFLKEDYRGQGISKQLIIALENVLIKRSIAVIRLETGIHQLEALGLYKHLGYQIREPYGAYKLDPLSIFMEKKLKIA
jgi:putative acetyltransferase